MHENAHSDTHAGADVDADAHTDELLEGLPQSLWEEVRPRRTAPEPTEPRGVPGHVGKRAPSYSPTPTGAPSIGGGDWYSATLPDTVLDGGTYGPLTVRGVSVRGDAHRHLHECRQDALGVIRLGHPADGDGLLLLTVADGVGAAPLSHCGSHAMVTRAAQCLDEMAGPLALALREGNASGFRTLAEDAVNNAATQMRQDPGLSMPPEHYATTLRGLLVPLDPDVRTRGFFSVGDGGLFLLRGEQWYDLDAPSGARGASDPSRAGTAGVIDTRTAALPVAYDGVDTRLLAPSRPGDVLVLCTDGLEAPLAGTKELRDLLAGYWGEDAPVPQPADFLWQAQTRVKSYDDDRTVVCLWEGTTAEKGKVS